MSDNVPIKVKLNGKIVLSGPEITYGDDKLKMNFQR